MPSPQNRIEARVVAADVVPGAVVPPRPSFSSALHLAAVVEYCVSTAPGSPSPHQGLGLAAIGDFGRVELFTAVELPLPTEQTIPTGTVSLFDVPVRAGARLTFGATRLVTAVGFFGAAHLLSASSTSSGGARAAALTAAGGGGLEALARGPMFWRFSWEIRVWAEALAQRTWFVVEGKPVIETGRYAVGLGLGFALPTR